MAPHEKTALWQKTLATRVDDGDSALRDRLRTAYERTRARAAPLAEAIANSLPDYTVHDITHTDALWEYATLIAGQDYPMNPCEAFVLGCAFLVHDLGMGLAAYTEGIAGLKQLDLWKQVAGRLRGQMDIAESEVVRERRILAEVLRTLHAQRAASLPLLSWTDPSRDEQYFLIDDQDLRNTFGTLIGRIAYSHWWPVDRVRRELGTVTGSPGGFPQDWTVDSLKLACLLRCADYCHLDDRRAPAYLRALRRPMAGADDHWIFQENLYQPRLEEDRLIFTSKRAFNATEAAAWWTCFDTLRGIDKELRQVDALLADMRRERLAACAVSQVDDPARLSHLVTTDGWRPVDARIQVGSVADLVSKLGGKELYGDSLIPPLRELIQNAADAVRARRLLDRCDSSWGLIDVVLGNDSSGRWISVTDTGVGMSEAVLTGPLLDFGKSFWSSDLAAEEFPALHPTSFRPTGRYGIGFFSTFMWGPRIQVVSQRYDAARSETLALEFRDGLKGRPLVREAVPNEYINGGGTRIKVWITDELLLQILNPSDSHEHSDSDEGLDGSERSLLCKLCASIAPCLDVMLRTGVEGDELLTAVRASDWLTIDKAILLKRLSYRYERLEDRSSVLHDNVPDLRILLSDSGEPVGRAALWTGDFFSNGPEIGVVTVGGFAAMSLQGMVGVLAGTSVRAARDIAIPIVPLETLQEFATEEAKLRISEGRTPEILKKIFLVLQSLNITNWDLPMAETRDGWRSLSQICELAPSLSEVFVIQDARLGTKKAEGVDLLLDGGVIAVSAGRAVFLSGPHPSSRWPPWPQPKVDRRDWFRLEIGSGPVIIALAKGWGVPSEKVLAESMLSNDQVKVKRRIGLKGQAPVVETVDVICKPRP